MESKNYKHTIFASYIAIITQAIVNNLAPLLFIIFRDSFGIPLSRITLIITVNFLVQLFVDLLSAKFVDRIGYRKCIVMAHLFAAIGIVGISVLPMLFENAFAALLLSSVIYAIGGGLIEVLASPIVESCPTDDKSSAMSLLHSFYCWGTVGVILLSTLFLGALGNHNWRFLTYFWALIPIFNAVFLLKVPIAPLIKEGRAMTILELVKNKTFILFIVIMIAGGAAEQSVSQWASAFAEAGLGVSKTVGDIAGPCAFSVFMGLSRVFYSKNSGKINLLSFILGSSILCVGSYLMISLSPVSVVSLVGCAICGLSVGILWPGIFSLASERFPKGGTAMFAILALAGDFGCSSGPTVVGMISGALGDNLKAGILSSVIFPAVLVAGCLVYKYVFYKKQPKKK